MALTVASAACPASGCLRQAFKVAFRHQRTAAFPKLAVRTRAAVRPAASLTAVEQSRIIASDVRTSDRPSSFAGAVTSRGVQAGFSRRHTSAVAAGATKQKKGGKEGAEAAEPLPNEKERPDMPWVSRPPLSPPMTQLSGSMLSGCLGRQLVRSLDEYILRVWHEQMLSSMLHNPHFWALGYI